MTYSKSLNDSHEIDTGKEAFWHEQTPELRYTTIVHIEVKDQLNQASPSQPRYAPQHGPPTNLHLLQNPTPQNILQ